MPALRKKKAAAGFSESRIPNISRAILTGIFSIDGSSPLSSVFTEYLDLEDIGILDTAVCNISLRPLYLDAMRHLTRSSLSVDSAEFIKWNLLRGIKTKELIFTLFDEINDSLVMVATASYGFLDNLLSLHLPDSDEVDYSFFMPVLLLCKNLQELKFSAENISLNHLKLAISVFRKLTCLEMHSVDLDSDAFNFLTTNCSALKTLAYHTYMPDLLDDSNLLSVVNGLTSLTSLSLYNYGQPRVYSFSEVALTGLNGLKMLEDLQLDSIPNLTTDLLVNICHSCDKIVTLGLYNMPQLENLSFETFERLESLYLVDIPVTDEVVYSIASHCSKLKILDLDGSREITDIAIDYVANGVCQSLETLNLTGCTQVISLPNTENKVQIKTVKKIIAI